jgi:Xaa-Pro dipeptidase
MVLKQLIEAEEKAKVLFELIVQKGLIKAGQTEKALNDQIFKLAEKELNIQKYWHKRIVRAGENTLCPYDENPPDLLLSDNDILFLDFGPIFEDWEADFGRTFVIGEDPVKLKLKDDCALIWEELSNWIKQHQHLKASEIYHKAETLAAQYGWKFGGEIAGHLVGKFPHERIANDEIGLYIHPENDLDIFAKDDQGQTRHWILEIHIIDEKLKIGGFFEQLIRW